MWLEVFRVTENMMPWPDFLANHNTGDLHGEPSEQSDETDDDEMLRLRELRTHTGTAHLLDQIGKMCMLMTDLRMHCHTGKWYPIQL